MIDFKAPGVYFFSLKYDPNEKINSVLVVPETGMSFEISYSEKKLTYWTDKKVHFTINNKYSFLFLDFLKKLGYDSKDTAISFIRSSYIVKQPAESEAYIDMWMQGSKNIFFGKKVWNELIAINSQLLPTADYQLLTKESLVALVNQLVALSEGKVNASLVDGETYTTYVLKGLIAAHTGNLYLDKLKTIDLPLAEVISNLPLPAVYLNGLKSLNSATAFFLGKCQGRLFLNGLKVLDKESVKYLTSFNLKYLSLRGFKEDDETIKRNIVNKNCFVSLSSIENITEDSVNYSKEEIANSVASDKKQFSSLKKLLTTVDKTVIDTGLTLLSSFSDPYLFDKLLENVTISTTSGISKFETDKLFEANVKEQPFFNYAISGILFYAGSDCLLAEKLKSSVTQLSINIIDLSYLHCFSGLKELLLTDSSGQLTSLIDLNPDLELNSVQLNDCPALEVIDRLADYPLTSFNFTNCNKIKSFSALKDKRDLSGVKTLKISDNNNLEDLEGLQFFQSLESLDLTDCKNLNDISALDSITTLSKIESFRYNSSRVETTLPSCNSVKGLIGKKSSKINLRIKDWGSPVNIGSDVLEELKITCNGMKDLDWLKGFPNIIELRIDCADLLDITGLKYASKIQDLTIDSAKIADVKGIEKLLDLNLLFLQSCTELLQIDDIASLPKLEKVEVRICKKLISVVGISKNVNLKKTATYFNFDSLPSLKTLGDFSGFLKLEKISFDQSFNQSVLQDLVTCTPLKSISIYQKNVVINNSITCNFQTIFEHSLEIDLKNSGLTNIIFTNGQFQSLKGIEDMEQLVSLSLIDCAELETLDGLKNLNNIKSISLDSLELLESIDSFSKLKSLEKIKFSKLKKLKNISPLAYLSSLVDMETEDCKLLEVKPRPLGKMNALEIAKYQLKIAEFYKLENIGSSQIKTVNASASSENKETKKSLIKIKKLIQSRDIDMIVTAITLLEGLQDEALCNALLEGTTYNGEELVPNKIFTGTAPAQLYLNTALVGILNCANIFPNWKHFNDSIGSLNLEIFSLNYINCFTNLTSLQISGIHILESNIVLNKLEKLSLSFGSNLTFDFSYFSSCTSLKLVHLRLWNSNVKIKGGLDKVANFTQLQHLKIDSIQSGDISTFKPLQACQKLEKIEISTGYNSSPIPLNSLEGLEFLEDLKVLVIGNSFINNTSAIRNLKKVEIIEINSNELVRFDPPADMRCLKKLNLGGCAMLQFMEDAQYPQSIENVSLSGSSILSFPTFNGTTEITKLDISNCSKMEDLDGFSKLLSVGNDKLKFEFNNCWALIDINDIFHLSFRFLKFDFTIIPDNIINNSIQELQLQRLENLDGITQFNSLESLNLDCAQIKTLQPLLHMPQLSKLYLGSCDLTSLSGIENLKNLKVLSLTRMEYLKDISALDNLNIEKVYISGCLLKKADFPAHLQNNIDWMTIP